MVRLFPSTLGLCLLLLLSKGAEAATYYVSPTGDDDNAGTLAEPFQSVSRAQTAASAGDIIYLRGGTYAFSGSGTGGVVLNKSGAENSPISYFAYESEVPVLDLSALTPSGRVTGLDINASWIHVRGLEVTGVHQFEAGQDSWAVRIRGNSNIVEHLNVHHNDAPGIFITSGANNLILNSDSHHNFDFLEDGGSADGFGCHSTGSNNVMRGCRAYDNSDDGFDFINAPGSCIAEDSWAFRNGWEPDTTTASGNGAGFKAGGYGSPPTVPASGAAEHTVQRSVAFGNRSQGFYANHHPGRINFLNNTAYRNSVNYNLLADDGFPSDHVLTNNIALAPGTAISNLSGGTATFNSWNLTVTVDTDDFESVMEELADSARGADGSLPVTTLLRLVEGSDLIDAGTDVGFEFAGAAPDLGAFEFGLPPPGTGGSGGDGNSGVGGAPGAGTGSTSGEGGGATGGAANGGGAASGTGGAAAPGEDDGAPGCSCDWGRQRNASGAWLLVTLALGAALGRPRRTSSDR